MPNNAMWRQLVWWQIASFNFPSSFSKVEEMGTEKKKEKRKPLFKRKKKLWEKVKRMTHWDYVQKFFLILFEKV